ncbi:MAG: hypothetical protein AAGF11_40465 [Myxococcota bacterium]
MRLKARVFAGRLSAWSQASAWVRQERRARHQTELRRELQRYIYLADGIAVPPAVHLDRAWRTSAERKRVVTIGRAAGWVEFANLLERSEAALGTLPPRG